MKKEKVQNFADKTPKRRGNGPDIVYSYLRDKIINTRLVAGARIEERKIVEELGLSRTPVRQAFMRMAAEGLIELLPYHGARVPPLNIEEVRSFLEAFEFLLLATAHLATRRRTEQDLEEIFCHRDAYKAAAMAQDIKGMIETNEEFHLSVARAGHNSHMVRLVGDMLVKALRLDGFWYGHTFNPRLEKSVINSLQEHQELVQAIEDQDLQKVEDITRQHVRSFRMPLVEYLCQNEADEFNITFSE